MTLENQTDGKRYTLELLSDLMIPASPQRGVSSEEGFGLIELIIAMVVLQVALLAIIGAFGTGAAALGRSATLNTATALADQQMELYRAMPYNAIGLDTAGAPTTGTYVADTVACPAARRPFAPTPPRATTRVPRPGVVPPRVVALASPPISPPAE